jgi:hypothetical protein
MSWGGLALRQLAVAEFLSMSEGVSWAISGICPVKVCLGLISILSDPANRAAIQGELAMAAANHLQLRDAVAMPSNSGPNGRPTPEFQLRPWSRAAVQPFPFLSTCLIAVVGQAFGLESGSEGRAQTLGQAYDDESWQEGMAVVDVSRGSAKPS